MVELAFRLLSKPRIFAGHPSDVWGRTEEGKGAESQLLTLGLAAVCPGYTVCGEWSPSGVLSVTCPDTETSEPCALLRSGVG